jgi:hypothetical protein
MNFQCQGARRSSSASGLLEEDRETQVQQVMRMLQGSWAQLASDLQFLETARQPAKQ